jgi:hypothetical protein
MYNLTLITRIRRAYSYRKLQNTTRYATVIAAAATAYAMQRQVQVTLSLPP